MTRKTIDISAIPILAAMMIALFPPLSTRAVANDLENANVTKSPPLFTPRVFTRGSFVYLAEPRQIVFLSMDTRSSHTVYNAPDEIFQLTSAVQSGDMIFAANGAGAVVAVNMQTGTVEDYGRGRVAPEGRIDADGRHLWLAANDTLFRMNMATREWVPIPIIGGKGDDVRAVVSFNDQIHVIASKAVHVFTPASDNWQTVPHPRFTLESSNIRRDGNICNFVQGKTLYRYDPSKVLWSRASVRDVINSSHLIPNNYIVAAGDRIYRYNANTLTFDPLAQLPVLRDLRAVTRHNGRIVSAADKGIAIYNPPFDIDIAHYPAGMDHSGVKFSFSYYDHIILYAKEAFYLYHHDRRLWSSSPIRIRDNERNVRHAWDEDGAHSYLTDDIKYSLHGTATAKLMPSATRTPSDGVSIEPGSPMANATLNVHTVDGEGRFIDLTIDNAVTTLPPEKGFYYKGIEGDILDRAAFGIQATQTSAGQVIPGFQSEGVSATVQGGAKAEDRDRSLMTATAGAGHILSKQHWATFRYNYSGVYTLPEHTAPAQGRHQIDPTNIKVYVDGAELPGTDYHYEPNSRNIRILRRDKTDPTSLIQVAFSIRMRPENDSDFETFPSRYTGQYAYAEGSVAPRSWLTANAGVMNINRSEAQRFDNLWQAPDDNSIIYAGMPVEWRDGSRSVLVDPQIAYDNIAGAHSSGINLGIRENRAFGSYRGLWASRDFWGADRRYLSESGNNLNEDHAIDFGYDLRDDLRVTWYQTHRRSLEDSSSVSLFGLRGAYIGSVMPDIEMSVSSRLFENERHIQSRERKETYNLRVSDLTSSYLTRKSGMHNVGYELSLTEYSADDGRSGRTLNGLASVSPIDKLTLVGTGMYRVNPQDHVNDKIEINPGLSISLRDLPRGIDANAGYYVHVYEFNDGGNWITVVRNLSAYIYPGEYVDALKRFVVFLDYYNELQSLDSEGNSILELSFLKTNETELTDIWETGEVIYFPIDNLLLSTLKQRHRERGLSTEYYSRERAKFWFESGSAIEGIANIYMKSTQMRLNGNAMYEHRWNETLMTGIGAHGTRFSDGESPVDIYGGPQAIVTLTKEFSGTIRAVENSHRLQMTINKREMKRPDLWYTQYLRIKIFPTISVVGEATATAERLRNVSGNGGIYLHAGF